MESAFFFTILLIILAGYYSLVTFPKQRAFKKQMHFVSQMQIGTEIITSGGILGIVTAIDDERGLATVQIAEGIQIQIIMAAIRPYGLEEITENARRALDENPSP